MSKFHMSKIKCPVCKSEIDVKIWDSINTSLNREEKEKILNGTFYDVKCPHCQASINCVYGFLYHDMVGKYMVSVYCDFTDVIKRCGIPRDYRLRKVNDIWLLVEKIKIFDCGLNDIVIEIVKQTIRDLLKTDYDLLFVDRKDGKIIFQINDMNNNGITIDDSIYDAALEICGPGDLTEKYCFMEVNREYANII